MQFLFIIPIAAAFGNYFIPLMIGARDMALPPHERLWLLAVPLRWPAHLRGPALRRLLRRGVGSRTFPFSSSEYQVGAGMDTWILGLQLVGFSSIFAGINFIVPIVNLRTPGMGWRQLPMFGWRFSLPRSCRP